MSTAVVERVVEKPRTLEVVPPPQVSQAPEPAFSDAHPLFPVFVAGAISLLLAGGAIGSILIWLAVRHSGIVAP